MCEGRCEGMCEGMCEGICEGMCTVYTRYSSMNLDQLRYIFACRKIRIYLIFFIGMITRTLHQTAAILQNILQKKTMTEFHDCIFAVNNFYISISVGIRHIWCRNCFLFRKLAVDCNNQLFYDGVLVYSILLARSAIVNSECRYSVDTSVT